MRKYIKDDKGLTLVEVVAATVILTLLLTSFLSLLLSGAKSTQQARDIVDYTFIAQSNMETIFESSRNVQLTELESMMTSELSYDLIDSDTTSSVFSKTATDPNNESYEIKVTFFDYVPQENFESLSSSLNRIIVEIFPPGKNNPYAKIESLLEWNGYE